MLQRLKTALGQMQTQEGGQPLSEELLEETHGAVTDLITGVHTSGYWKHKGFVLQIVASILDADKIDYLMRDMLLTNASTLAGLQELFVEATSKKQRHINFVRLIDNSRLVKGDVCFSMQDLQLLQQVFRARFLMHKHVYQHADVKGFELMVADVLRLAEPSLKLEWLKDHLHLAKAGPDEVDKFIKCFTSLRDPLLDDARRRAMHNNDGDEDLTTARAIISLYDADEVYPCVAEEDDPEGYMSGDRMLCKQGVRPTARAVAVGAWQGGVERVRQDWSSPHPPTFRTRKVRVYLVKHCSADEVEQHTATLKAALQTVLQQAEAAAPAAAVVAAEKSAGIVSDVGALDMGLMLSDEEAALDDMDAELLPTQEMNNLPAAAVLVKPFGCSVSGCDNLNSLAAETPPLLFTPAAAEAAAAAWTPVSASQDAQSWLQEREQQMMPFPQPEVVCSLQPSSSLQPTVLLATASSVAAAAAAPAAAADDPAAVKRDVQAAVDEQDARVKREWASIWHGGKAESVGKGHTTAGSKRNKKK